MLTTIVGLSTGIIGFLVGHKAQIGQLVAILKGLIEDAKKAAPAK